MESSGDPMIRNRRDFLKGVALVTGSIAVGSQISSAPTDSTKPDTVWRDPEWRNKTSEMSYRQLGRTGLMVSEIVAGGSGPMTPENYKTFHYAIERGLNYFDTASRYSKGESEKGLGMLLSEKGVRDQLFVSTKLSDFQSYIDKKTQSLFESLSSNKKEMVRKRAKALMHERGVNKHGYFIAFFPGQERDLLRGYEHYQTRKLFASKSWVRGLKEHIIETFHGSLERLQTDYVDILHCPHGARVPEELDEPLIWELFEKFRTEGKARFLGFSCHTDQYHLLSKAIALGHYDMAMIAYNIANQGSIEPVFESAYRSGMGLIGMKAAAGVYTSFKKMPPIPQWRIQKLNQTIPQEMKLQPKAYLWALQNPHLSAVISEMYTREMIEENLAVVGKKVELSGV